MDDFTIINDFIITQEERLQAIAKEYGFNIEEVSEMAELFCEINLINDLREIENNYDRITSISDGNLAVVSAINCLVGEEF